MARSKIEWTGETWNPTVGCDKLSQGCKFCYAEVMHKRLTAMGVEKYAEPFRGARLWEPHLELPLKWTAPRLVFVNSMSDLFHKDLPLEDIRRVFDVMVRAKQHTFQVLTKRAQRLAQVADQLPWPKNVWMGVSVEDASQKARIDHLRQADAKVRFLSVEPLLGPLGKINLEGIHWVIVGGESGHKARPMDPAWAREVRDQCLEAGVPFFLKQLGGKRKKRGGDNALLDGRLWRELPKVA